MLGIGVEEMREISERALELRKWSGALSGGAVRVASALARVGTIWQERLENGWEPPAGSAFPWVQVRRSLAALVPGLLNADEWQARVINGNIPQIGAGKVAALVLAGNTPLMAWSPLCACLLAGWGVYVKMSRDETLWPRLFWETLNEADPEVAALVHLDVWPGDDPRTGKLVQTADAVVAYGSDSTLAAIKAQVPSGVPFFGYGHAVSVGLTCGEWDVYETARGFAQDVLMFGQGGCLSPHVLFTANTQYTPFTLGRDTLPNALAQVVDAFNARNLDTLATLFSKDLEFYHDKNGRADYSRNLNAFKENFARPTRTRRELDHETLEVYPVQGFGAMQIGVHRFYETEPGQKEKLTATAKFVHVWKNTKGAWQIVRAVSYAHQ